MNVFILATCLRTELWPYTELVFRTLRVGFPTAAVTVYLNTPPVLEDGIQSKMANLEHDCETAGFAHKPVNTIHHEWIEQLVSEQKEPFFIVDTDVIFYGNMEQFTYETALAGWRIPEWVDEFAGAVTRARLHTSLLYIDPVKLKAKVATFWDKVFDTKFTTRASLFDPLFTAFMGKPYFYDTCSMLYQAVGGEAFAPKHKNCYFHMNFGTLSHLVLPRLKEAEAMHKLREEILANPALGIGRWRDQEQWYEQRQL